MTTSSLGAAERRRLSVLLVATACNLGIWVLTAFFATSEFYRRSIVMGGAIANWNEVLYLQLCTALLWAAYTPLIVFIAERLPLRSPHRVRNSLAVAGLIPLLAMFRAAFGGAIHNLAEFAPVSWEFVSLSLRIRSHRGIAIVAVIFFISYLLEARREAAERERQRVRAQTLLARTEIDELRTRLQPQFALRMLRHIGSVLRDEPQAADALIVTLSGILRRSMARGPEEWIPLADELEHFDRCVDLCRAGGRFALTARYVAGEDVLSRRVPALVLQPVIDAVVLDLTSEAGGSVEVRCTRGMGETRIDVAWTASPGGRAENTTLCVPCQEEAIA